MAKRITAINTYRPRIKRAKTGNVNNAASLIAGRTSVNHGAVLQALKELQYVLLFHLRQGSALSLPGLGTFFPHIALDGRIKVSLRVDRELLSELNKEAGGFSGDVINRDNIGKTVDELITFWNTDHPDDPVE